MKKIALLLLLCVVTIVLADTSTKTPRHWFNATRSTLGGSYNWIQGDSSDVIKAYPADEDTTGLSKLCVYVGGPRRLWYFSPDSTDVYDFYYNGGDRYSDSTAVDTLIAGMQDVWVQATSASEEFVSTERALADDVIETRHIKDEQITIAKLDPDNDGYFTLTYPVRGDSASASDTLQAYVIQNSRWGTNTPVYVLNQAGAAGNLHMKGLYTSGGWYWGDRESPTWYVEEDEAVLPGVTRYSPTGDGDSLAIVSAETVIRGGKVRIGTQAGSTADSLVVRNRARFLGRTTFDSYLYAYGSTNHLGEDSTDAVSLKGKTYDDHGRMIRGTTSRKAYDEISDGDGEWLKRGMVDLDEDTWGEIFPMRTAVVGVTNQWVDPYWGLSQSSWYFAGVDTTWQAMASLLPARSYGGTWIGDPGCPVAGSGDVDDQIRDFVVGCIPDSVRICWDTSVPDFTGAQFLIILVKPGAE